MDGRNSPSTNKLQIGDDLFVTNTDRLREGIEQGPATDLPR